MFRYYSLFNRPIWYVRLTLLRQEFLIIRNFFLFLVSFDGNLVTLLNFFLFFDTILFFRFNLDASFDSFNWFHCAKKFIIFLYAIQYYPQFFFSITLYFWSFLGDLITPLRSNLVLRLIRSIYFIAQIFSLFLNIIRNFLGNLRIFRRFARSSSIIRGSLFLVSFVEDLIALLKFLILFFLLFRHYSFFRFNLDTFIWSVQLVSLRQEVHYFHPSGFFDCSFVFI